MSEAYHWIEDPGQKGAPVEVALARAIDRFGAKAVTGKEILRPGLVSRITTVENVIMAYKLRKQAVNWASFDRENPELAAMLIKAEQYAIKG